MKKAQSPNPPPLQAFISHLYRAGAHVTADQFQAWALQELKNHIAFDAAVWGMGNAQRMKFHNVMVFGAPQDYAVALEETRHLNPIPTALLRKLGSPVRMEDVFSDKAFYRSELYHRCFQRFGVERILSSGHVDARSGLYTLLSLYRGKREQPFSTADKNTFEAASYHLIAAYSHVFFLHLTRPKPALGARVAAVVDAEGVLHEVQPGFLDLIEQAFPQWRGPRLPFFVPPKELEFSDHGLCISVKPLADLFLLRIWKSGPLDLLTVREREIVQAVCRGLSHKEIGRQMGLAPTTVSSHLYRAYHKLGVESRTALAHLVHGTRH
ncbi:MAG: response regulator transcription factor [Nevskiales bacterium]